MDATAARQLHRRLVAVIAGVEDDDFITGVNHRLDRTEDALGGSRGDGHFRIGAHMDAVAVENLRSHLAY